jgi:TPR repeat protein
MANERLTFHFPRAEKGDAHGQYELAIMYLNGRTVERDAEQAVYWLEKSATQNFRRAVRLLEKLLAGEPGT